MSKIKSTFVTAIVFAMLAVITIACSKLCWPVYAVIIGIMTTFGFAGCALAFCKWLQKPAEVKEESFDPVDISPAEPDLDFQRVWDEIKSEESEAKGRV